MTTLTDKFTTFEEEVASNHTLMMARLVAIEEALTNVNTNLDTLILNGATNTRYLLAAIGQNSPCAPCPTPPILVPPIEPFELPINTDKCKRAQAFLATMRDMFGVWDTFSSFDLSSNFAIITDAIGQVIARMGAGDVVPLPSFPESVQLGGTLASYTAYNLFTHTSMVAEFDAIYDVLLPGIYGEATPEGAKAFYDANVYSGMSSHFLSDLATASAYNALWSYFFDPDSEPDLTPYDGSICEDHTGCETVEVPVTTGTSNYDFGGETYGRIDLDSVTFNTRINSGTRFTPPIGILASRGGLTTMLLADHEYTIGEVTSVLGTAPRFLDSSPAVATFVIEFCDLSPE